MTTDPSVRRLVDGVLVPGFDGTAPPEWLRRAIDGGLGGVCWFAQNVPDLDTARALADQLHGQRDDLLVLSDEEGGGVTRLEAATGSSWPGNAALGVVDDLAATEAVGAGIGALARRAGVDVVLSPAVDVNSEPDNPVIGVRSFGAAPDLVARHGAAFVRGVQSAGVGACAKHFPGHGATRTDSHVGLPTVEVDLETVRGRDLVPFVSAIEAGVRCVLTAHVIYPALDDQPATMSEAWMSLLREALAFDGVIVTDALDMHAISRRVGRGPGAVAAMRAGVDLLCIGNPTYPEPYDVEAVLDEVRAALVDAVAAGELPVERLESATDRTAALATWPEPAPTASTGTPREATGLEVARRAIRAVGVERLRTAPCVIVERRTDLTSGIRRSWVVTELIARDPGTVAFDAESPSDLADARKAWDDRPVVVVTDGLSGVTLRQAVRAERPDAVVVHTGPAGTGDAAAPMVRSFGAGRVNATAVAELLLGELS